MTAFYPSTTDKMKTTINVPVNGVVQGKIDRIVNLNNRIKPMQAEFRSMKDEIKQYPVVEQAYKGNIVHMNGNKGGVNIYTATQGLIEEKKMSKSDATAYQSIKSKYTTYSQVLRLDVV